MQLLIVAAIVFLIDQLTKFLVQQTMEVGQSISVINDFLYITYVKNPGAAFGMLPYNTIFFILITIMVIAFIIYYYRLLNQNHRWLRLALALQLGGALGNLVDRIFREGYVVDFINFTIWPPVFNIADSALVIGIGIFVIAFWRDPDLRSGRI